MFELIIAAIILLIIMLIFVFILFKNIIRRINENAKIFFVNKMENYDYILEEKQKKLEELTKNIEKLEINQTNLELENNDLEIKYRNEKQKYQNKNANSINYNLEIPKYREGHFFYNYKQIKKVFSGNNEQIIKDFIKEHINTKEMLEYNELKEIRNMFDEETIYECLTLDREAQKELLNDIIAEKMTKEERDILRVDFLIEQKNFDIRQFINCIDERLEQIDPKIYVYINGKTSRYENIDKNLVIEQYNNISEGIIIKYRNKIYDYSI